MIRGTKTPKMPDVGIRAGLHNRFDIEVFDTKTQTVRQKAVAFNVVLNQYFTRSYQGAFDYIWYGTGNGTPAETDTGLFDGASRRVLATVDTYSINRVTGVGWVRKKATLLETVAVGLTITEIGLGGDTGTGSCGLCTHAMLLDMNGNQISITKTDTDIITLYATVYVHWETGGYDNGHIFITQVGSDVYHTGVNPASADWVCRLLGGAVVNTTGTVSKRIAADKQNTVGGLVYTIDTANNIGFRLCYSGAFPVVNEPVGTGDGSTTDFAVAFDLPSDATVYVDGVEQSSGVTVYPAIVGDIARHLQPIAPGSTPDNLVFTVEQEATYSDYGISITSLYFYNPFYERGLSQVTVSHVNTLKVSNDLVNWTTIPLSGGASSERPGVIPAAHAHDRFLYFDRYSYPGKITSGIIAGGNNNGKAIHFDEPPAPGSIITASYTTPCAPKDINHVLDYSVTITIGRYEGET